MPGIVNLELPPGFTFDSPEAFRMVNQRLRAAQDAIERLSGARGPISLSNDIQMNGHRIKGLGYSQDQEDVINVKEGNDRYFQTGDNGGRGGGGGGGGGGDVGDAFLIPVPITANITITQAYLASIDTIATGNHPIAVAVIQDDDTGGHLVAWSSEDFHGPSTTGLNQASGEWSVDDGPQRVTVYTFWRHPTDLKWWLGSWISYDSPDAA